VEHFSDGDGEEPTVKVAPKLLGKAAGINKETPEGIHTIISGEVG
jgi:hypothetical protein